uniref:Glycoprotein n=1 Tax=maize Iranian mosaic virus TaxID=348823 RepID=A0A3G2LYQ9_9RHAB|nr:glycoprotein [maize Iranian mosaic virus]AYN79096.1 glycoprotein [maize Iranian mosaic virus]
MATSFLLLLSLSSILAISATSAPALTSGRIPRDEEPSSDKGDSDLYPLYECGKEGTGVPITSWYGACRGACSMASNSTEVVAEIYYRNDSVGYIDVLSVRTTEIKKTSHVTWYGACDEETIVGANSLAPEYIIEQSIEFLHSGLDSWQYGADIHVHDTIGFPDCDYLDDKNNEGWRFIITKRAIELKSDIAGEGYIVDPDLGYVFPVSDGIGRGKFWYIWKSSSVPSGGCYFKSAGTGNCTLLMDTFTYSCPELNVAFSAKVNTKLEGTCVGDLNISSDGVSYALRSQQSTGSVSSALINLWHQSQEAVTQQLILVINDALGKIESSYCEASCDLTEALFYRVTDNPAVVETPVGPWLPSLSKGKVSIIPCQSEQQLIIILPIEICYEPFMLKVKSLKTGETFWWLPSHSHVTSSTSCRSIATEEVEFQGELKKPLTFEFWRGMYLLPYPYNGSGTWIDNPGTHIHRSSKWFPSINQLSYSVPIKLPLITKEIRKHVQQTVVSIGGFSNITSHPITEGIWTALSTAGLIIGKTAARVVMWWSELEETVKGYITLAGGVIISLLVGYLMLKTILLTRRPSYSAVPREVNWITPSK